MGGTSNPASYLSKFLILHIHSSLDIRHLQNSPVPYYKCKHRYYPVLFKGILLHKAWILVSHPIYLSPSWGYAGTWGLCRYLDGGRPGRAQTTAQLRCAEQSRKKPGVQSLPGAVYSEDTDLDSSKSENYLLPWTGSLSFSFFFQ